MILKVEDALKPLAELLPVRSGGDPDCEAHRDLWVITCLTAVRFPVACCDMEIIYRFIPR